MVHSCCICKISSEKDSSVSFHRFPKNGVQREIWLKSLSLDGMKISPSSKLCSKHFPEDSFRIREGGRRDLKPTAVPIFRSKFIKMFSDDSIVPQELNSDSLNSPHFNKDETENFTMFLTDNLELFPDLKTEQLDGSELLLNESMETEVLDNESINNTEISSILDPIFSEKSVDLNVPSEQTPPKKLLQNEEMGELLDVDSLINKISADNNFKWRAYFKQCTVEDFSTPEMAKRNIELGKKEIEAHQKKIKILQQQNRRLKCRVARLKQLLKRCKQNSSIDFGNILDEDDELDI